MFGEDGSSPLKDRILFGSSGNDKNRLCRGENEKERSDFMSEKKVVITVGRMQDLVLWFIAERLGRLV